MNFSDALQALKDGKKVARAGWNGNKRPPIVSPYPKYVPDERIEYVESLDLVYIKLSNGDVAVCSGVDYDVVKQQEKWTISHGYPYYTKYENGVKKTLKLHSLIYGEVPDGYMIDHINGNKLDNRRENLRIALSKDNNANRVQRGGTSSYKGVSFDSSRGKWISSIQVDGKTTHIGRFDNEVECAKAYDRKAFEVYGQYAKLNFPNESLPPRMYLFIVCGDCIQDAIFSVYGNPKYPFLLDANGNPLDEPLPVNDAIYMKTADNKLVVWLASQTDLLAEDWEIL